MMIKPQRLIYREIGDALTEGVPNALEATLNYVPKTVEKASHEIQEVSSGVSKAVKGVLKGTGRVLDFFGRKVLWQDVAALPKTAAAGWYKDLKRLTVDTAKHTWKREWKKAGKSFLGGLFGAAVVTPLKAIWSGAKGAVNIPLRFLYSPVEAVKVAGDLTGLTFENGGLATKNYGIVPAVGSILKGSVGTVTAPLYPLASGSTVPGWTQKFLSGDLALDTAIKKPAANAAPASSEASASATGGASSRPAARPTPPPRAASASPPPMPGMMPGGMPGGMMPGGMPPESLAA